MMSVAPASVLFVGLLGMLIVAYSVLRMTFAEGRAHRLPHPAPVEPVGPSPVPSQPRASL